MKRDWDVVRAVLEQVEALGDQHFDGHGFSYTAESPEDEVTRIRHLLLLRDAGFVRGLAVDTLAGPGLLGPELTWEGHELLGTIRSKTIWNRVKKLAADKGIELSFDVVKRLGKLALDQVLDGQ
ncbi:MAG: hypothetical protein DI563_22365 [Variovorax paradoxus]|uniref:DUF2513 domain-containing protein n=1 Tax=Variovorax paradoxus TaxID=34073 RepID=A0A2W5R904_VARPD|nr:MAG: hypothetical protein DI563_22365 [Variovorax paradoxus]